MHIGLDGGSLPLALDLKLGDKIIINGAEFSVSDGFAFVVPAGSSHNLINTSSDKKLKLYTLYTPPHHKDGTVHKTRADGEADTADHI